ncbi:hypothetical protein CR162_11400 [Pseudoroseomonas rhizosphaerae]|uniref:Uncharacterized protein n=1 Tax=Teichococcus rhizosphaerae TaxID=1335062 RepID=A0A2C7ACE0_9PROT|nr:hypothetical protein [Pseudoroseomonas rhizosphaerae]PHK94756.1 hypothetical protein CR162_11400 [Pseudoroseomonas rhizosphaerae]
MSLVVIGPAGSLGQAVLLALSFAILPPAVQAQPAPPIQPEYFIGSIGSTVRARTDPDRPETQYTLSASQLGASRETPLQSLGRNKRWLKVRINNSETWLLDRDLMAPEAIVCDNPLPTREQQTAGMAGSSAGGRRCTR